MPGKLDATSISVLLTVLLSAVSTYVAILLYTRIAGLRSFSKMSASDFAMTVAVGSLFASTIAAPEPSLIVGLYALGLLFVGQWILAFLRRRSDSFSDLVNNQPLLLMRGGTIIEQHMQQANVTRADLNAKLREANVSRLDQVKAVVFEATGDISVLHADAPDTSVDDELLADVRGW